MKKDGVWESMSLKTKPRDILCFECAEARLGRYIVFDDLKDCPVNEPFLTMVDRIVHELGRALQISGFEII